jgi:hypothetical protein
MGMWKNYLTYLNIMVGISSSTWYKVYWLDLCNEEMG